MHYKKSRMKNSMTDQKQITKLLQPLFANYDETINPADEKSLDGFDFHRCDDEILFEWWNESKELWLGQHDDDILRWTNGKYCLGNASNVSYSEKYEFSTLIALFENAFEEWGFLQ